MPHIACLVAPDETVRFFAYRGVVETEKEAHRFKDATSAHKAAKEQLGIGTIRQLPNNEARAVVRNARVRHKNWRYFIKEVKE